MHQILSVIERSELCVHYHLCFGNYPLLVGVLGTISQHQGFCYNFSSENAGFWFMHYVNTHILEPSGIAPGACCSATDVFHSQAMAYDIDQPEQACYMSESSEVNCGGHVGLRLSAVCSITLTNRLRNKCVIGRRDRSCRDHQKLAQRPVGRF